MGVLLKSVLLNALLVGAGGFAGNLLGCVLIGALAGLADSRQLFAPELRSFAFIGLLGGFTTFSTFGYETIAMARGGEFLRAASNVGLHVLIGLALVWFAYALTSSR
jgi:CrcB protein